MINATCQHTGLPFEAKSKAAKNHPTVSALLTEANRQGAYRAAVEALRECREELGENLTLADVERYVQAAIDGRQTEMQAERLAWRERREAYRERLNNWTPADTEVSNAELMSQVSHSDIDADCREEG